MSTGAVVLLSGGLDSTVCLALAARECDRVVAVSMDYGQRHRVELERAAAIAAAAGDRCEHLVVHLNADAWGGSSLTDPDATIPEASDAGGIPSTYVPARNLIFLSIAAGIAEARDLDAVYIGVNALDYSGYPDCRQEFIEAFRATLLVAQRRGIEGRPVEIRTPLQALSKADIVRLGIDCQATLSLSWSCYRGGEHPCGHCDSCHLRERGFALAGIADPALA